MGIFKNTFWKIKGKKDIWTHPVQPDLERSFFPVPIPDMERGDHSCTSEENGFWVISKVIYGNDSLVFLLFV